MVPAAPILIGCGKLVMEFIKLKQKWVRVFHVFKLGIEMDQ